MSETQRAGGRLFQVEGSRVKGKRELMQKGMGRDPADGNVADEGGEQE